MPPCLFTHVHKCMSRYDVHFLMPLFSSTCTTSSVTLSKGMATVVWHPHVHMCSGGERGSERLLVNVI